MNSVEEYFISMPDGVKLYTLVQLPAAGKLPTIIKRTPYAALDPDFEALKTEDTHGYAVVTQYCRGTSRSEGEFNAYLNEREDGLELLIWIRQQPFYNGELFLFGQSYLSSVHFSYLDTNPTDVKAAYLSVQDSERYNICFRNGFFKPGLHGFWVLKMHLRNQEIERNYTIDSFRTMPLSGMTEITFGKKVPYIEEVFLHPDPNDPFWSTPEGGSDYHDVCNRCSVPIMLVTAFYDIYTDGIFDMWRKLTPERRRKCALVVTPFEHSHDPKNVKPEFQDFADDGRLQVVAPDLCYAWFDHFRTGKTLDFAHPGKTVYYRLWDNKWVTVDELDNAPESKIFYLDTEHRLLPEKVAAGEISYMYNPYDPAPFEGGVCNNFGGLVYQEKPNSRYDIISFISEPQERNFICEGRIEVELHCKSTADDSCFYIRLDLVRDDKVISLRDDIDSIRRHVPGYQAGEECIIRYTLAPHAFKMLPGDRLRLDVSSSCVPYFQVHTNQPGLQAAFKTARSCRNTIITGNSFIRLFVRN